jgi:anti-sigma-K factor RskA
MTCEEFEDLADAYALDTVTPEERQVAAAHLASCAGCRSLLHELNGAVELLPFAASPVEPRAEVWERIAAALPPGQPKPRTNKRWWSPRLLAVAAIVLFSLLVGQAAWNVSLMRQVASLQQKSTPIPAKQSTLTEVSIYPVTSTNPAQSIRGELLYLPQQQLTILILHGLPQPQGLQVYQGWLLHLTGTRITDTTSIGLLNLVDDTASLTFSGKVTGYDAVAVSLEPGPEATPSAPRGKVIAFGVLKPAPSFGSTGVRSGKPASWTGNAAACAKETDGGSSANAFVGSATSSSQHILLKSPLEPAFS